VLDFGDEHDDQDDRGATAPVPLMSAIGVCAAAVHAAQWTAVVDSNAAPSRPG